MFTEFAINTVVQLETALPAFVNKVQVLESPLKNIITGNTTNIYL